MSRWFWHWSETFPTTFKLGLWRSFNDFHYFAHHQRKKFWSVEIVLEEEGIGKYVNVKTFLIPSFLCQSSGPELVATRYMYPTQPTVTMRLKKKRKTYDVCLLFFYCKKRLEYFDLLNHRTSTFVLQTVSSTDILRKVNNQIQK